MMKRLTRPDEYSFLHRRIEQLWEGRARRCAKRLMLALDAEQARRFRSLCAQHARAAR